MITTATVTCGPTLRARVEVLHQINERFFEVKVIEGRGGWDKPGKILMVRASIMSDIEAEVDAPESLTPAPVLDEPAPLSEPIDGEAYIEVLLARQAAYVSRNFPYGTHLAPLLESFVRDEDVAYVIIPEPTVQAKRTPKPRIYRSAESIRAELKQVTAQRDAIGGNDIPDRAAANLSPFARSQAAARAGRRRFAQMDRDLERYVALTKRIETLSMSLLMAEARES